MEKVRKFLKERETIPPMWSCTYTEPLFKIADPSKARHLLKIKIDTTKDVLSIYKEEIDEILEENLKTAKCCDDVIQRIKNNPSDYIHMEKKFFLFTSYSPDPDSFPFLKRDIEKYFDFLEIYYLESSSGFDFLNSIDGLTFGKMFSENDESHSVKFKFNGVDFIITYERKLKPVDTTKVRELEQDVDTMELLLTKLEHCSDVYVSERELRLLKED